MMQIHAKKRNFGGLAAAGALLVLGVLGSATPAAARTFVGIGVGFGVPVWGPAYYPPPVYYPPAYPPAYYYPPPAPEVQGNYGTVSPSSYSTDQCREYTSTQTIGGQPQQVVGTACRQQDGTWRIVR